ncbi:MAG: PIN domain-containing protein [Chloroflexi bacterium]|nr:PIN domain-containing protein [Chloroflexota bacterium]
MIEIWDTSALIVAARNPERAGELADALGEDEVAITEPILLEYLNGARNIEEYDRFDARLRAVRIVETNARDWARALEVHRQLAAAGAGHQRSVPLVDLIIAAVAERSGHPIVHIDGDYERIAAITGQANRRLGATADPDRTR